MFQELGATVVEVRVPDTRDAVADWPDNCAVEAAVAHERTFPMRRLEYGPVLTSVLERGAEVTGKLRRMRLKGEFAALFAKIDLLLCPVQPFAPLTLATLGTTGERPDLIARLQSFTCPFDMTGGPTVTLPGGRHDGSGMPVEFQIAADQGNEAGAIRSAVAYQTATDHHRRQPKI